MVTLNQIWKIEGLEKEGLDPEAICAMVGVSKATYHRKTWKKSKTPKTPPNESQNTPNETPQSHFQKTRFNPYKGFVRTKGKASVMRFKDGEPLLRLSEALALPSYAGVLAPDAVLYDFDDMAHAEAMLRIVEAEGAPCQILRTSRGMHFIFRDPEGAASGNRVRAALAVGLRCDVKTGRKNSYQVLKLEGEEREITRLWGDREAGGLPKWAAPVKTGAEFLGMEAGDGRNQALFNHILTLQAHGFTKDEARECCALINRHVMEDPLPNDELATVLRDGAFLKPVFFKGRAFLFDKFAAFLREDAHVVKIDGQPHFYRDGVYVGGRKALGAEMLRRAPQLSKTMRNEVYDYLDETLEEAPRDEEANLIAFRNGLYDVRTEKLLPFSPDHVITNRVDWDHNPGAAAGLADAVLDRVSGGDGQTRALLEEMAGYCLYRRNELGKAFLLTGDRSNGKSTFLDMVRNMLGERNVSALDLKEVEQRFRTAELQGKLANIGDDIGDEFIPNTGTFKKLVTGEELTAERKGQDPFKFRSYAKLLFSANSVPRLGKGKDSAAVTRRLVIVPFEARFGPHDPGYDPYIKYDLRKREAAERLILLALRGLRRVLAAKGFTEGPKVKRSLEEYEETNNPVLGFLKEVGPQGVLNQPTGEVYARYRGHCLINGLQPVSNIEFSRQVRRGLGVDIIDKKINGVKHHVFTERSGEA
jgi:putative DNA primase/helicase